MFLNSFVDFACFASSGESVPFVDDSLTEEILSEVETAGQLIHECL